MDAQILLLIPIFGILYAWMKTMPPPRKEVRHRKRIKKHKKSKSQVNPSSGFVAEDDSFDFSDHSDFESSTGFDYSINSDDSDYMSSDTDSFDFDWNDDGIGSNEWWNDPAYSSLEGNIYHHDD